MAGLHHVELWVADLEESRREWGWLLTRLGFEHAASWDDGDSWDLGGAYLTLTTSPNLNSVSHDRRAPGLNHLAFLTDSRAQTDAIVREASARGWTLLYAERYPHAGGPEHYAGWIENSAGFKAEIVGPRAEPGGTPSATT
ncbi:MAG: VOC family protein [Arthrobacter sp.]|jgi:catechol 2,3-dioxygenase-like lactoylglutathione lyase family enzyme|nr:VOC family protein [Arthrobacter sp.]